MLTLALVMFGIFGFLSFGFALGAGVSAYVAELKQTEEDRRAILRRRIETASRKYWRD